MHALWFDEDVKTLRPAKSPFAAEPSKNVVERGGRRGRCQSPGCIGNVAVLRERGAELEPNCAAACHEPAGGTPDVEYIVHYPIWPGEGSCNQSGHRPRPCAYGVLNTVMISFVTGIRDFLGSWDFEIRLRLLLLLLLMRLTQASPAGAADARAGAIFHTNSWGGGGK